MVGAIVNYFRTLIESTGNAWNRFWYTPTDTFTLCVLRAVVGIVALYTLLTYTPDLNRFFGPQGLVRVETVAQLQQTSSGTESESFAPVRFSYLSYLDSPTELAIAHGIGLVIVLLFTLGAWTRITSVLALGVVLSYIHRAPLLTWSMEPVLTFLMFYLCLGPAGAQLSWDSFRRRRKMTDLELQKDSQRESWGANIAIRLIQVHICIAYLMMGIAKLAGPLGGDAWWLGEAVWWMAARPDTRLVDLTGILQGHPYLIQAWTHLIVVFELAFPILIWNKLARPLLLGIAVWMWFSLALISGQTLFCLLMMIGSFAFVSPSALRLLLRQSDASATEGLSTKPV